MNPEVPGPEYHQLHTVTQPRFSRRLIASVLGVACMALFFLVLQAAFWQIVFALGFLALGRDVVAGLEQVTNTADPTPLTLAYLMVVLASSIPVVWLLTRVFHGLKPGWTSSINPRIRWKYLIACLGISVIALVATLVVSAFLPGTGEAGAETSGSLNPWTDQVRDYLLVIVLLTPLQAAGEEYVFRGYLTQVCGGVFADPRVARTVAVVVPSLLFAAAHGSQDLPIFFDRLAFGLVAGVMVIVTGGLEAGIALHVLNNWFAFGLALAFSDMAKALQPTDGSWWSIIATLTKSLVFLGLAWWVARKMGLRTRAEWGVLAGSGARVYSFPSVHHGPSGPSGAPR